MYKARKHLPPRGFTYILFYPSIFTSYLYLYTFVSVYLYHPSLLSYFPFIIYASFLQAIFLIRGLNEILNLETMGSSDNVGSKSYNPVSSSSN